MQEYLIDSADIALLLNEGMVEEDLTHSIQVAEKALDIARRTGAELDMELVGRGALFHDLGKTITHEIEHGLLGAERGAQLGLPFEINMIMEKHIRGGLTESEAKAFGLPVKDYTLHRLEERIIIYADRLVDIIHEDIVDVANELDAEHRFADILKNNIKYGKNDITTERYLGYHNEIQAFINGVCIDVPTLIKALSKGGVELLDVRRMADYHTGPEMIAGATWRAPELVKEWASELPEHKDVVVYCVRGGSVSKSVCKALRETGIQAMYLNGGLDCWRKNV